ncbi:hypothetical protein KCG51_03825 [Neisseria subflava]|uniref:hypothetical protein n=1 Tax=Neisseria subflava TaxID=28449 RepID=UPI00202A490C|nr:hypothetical protein [Neisseria subflava]MCL9778142.1 hypothetical protein [Neisseria subflava]UTG77889.1 hypothetical protein KCG51_03825 [Neisseria subflava]
MIIKMQRTFYPVGQGGFYSETFTTKNNKFNVVYDCGSVSSNVNPVIASSFNKNENIDILFISHFDSDHVNKIDILKKSVHQIRTVIMPLLSSTCRSILISVYTALGKDYENSLKIISNPNDFFGEGTKIIHIEEDAVDIDDESNQEIYDITKIIEDELKFKSGKSISFSINTQSFWIYKPYNYKDKIRYKELIREFRKNNISIKKLKNIDYTKKNIKKIRDCYKKVSGNINQNSLILYSNIIPNNLNSNLISKCFIFPSYWFNQFCFHTPNYQLNIGCIFTGDVNLKTIGNDFIAKIKGDKYYLPVNTIQVPHHGSKNGFDINFFNDFSEGRRRIISPISFGSKNLYGHPSSTVITQLTSDYHLPVYVTDDKRDLFTQVFEFQV